MSAVGALGAGVAATGEDARHAAHGRVDDLPRPAQRPRERAVGPRDRQRRAHHRQREPQPHADADDQQRAEPAHHRHRRQQQHEEAGGRRQRRGGDRLHARARLALDRVVDDQAEQDRDDRDRGQGQRQPDQREPAEHHRARGQRDRQRQQPQPRPEQQHQHERHHHDGDRQQPQRRAGQRRRQVVGQHRRAGDDVRRAARQLPLRHRHRIPHERDRPRALRIRQPGLQPHRDQRGRRGREQVREARLRHARAARRVEHELVDEVRVVEPRRPRQVEPVLGVERDQIARELRVHEPRRAVGEPARLRLGLPLGQRQLARRRRGAIRLRRPRARLRLQLGGDLLDRRVHERPRPVDDLHGAQARQRTAGARRDRPARHVPGQAPLDAHEPVQVRREHHPRQVAAHEHVDRVVAELLVRHPRRVARGAHQRPRGRRGRQPQRQHGAADRDREDGGEDDPGPT